MFTAEKKHVIFIVDKASKNKGSYGILETNLKLIIVCRVFETTVDSIIRSVEN